MSKKPQKSSGNPVVDTRKKVARIADDHIETLFTDAFAAMVASTRGDIEIQEFDCKVQRELGQDRPVIDVRVYGMAGTTLQEAFYNKEAKKVIPQAKVIKVTLDDDSVAKFNFVSCMNLTVNDYMVSYQLE